MTILTILGITEILYSFELVLEGKTGKEVPESSRLEFLEKKYSKHFYFNINKGQNKSIQPRRTLEMDEPLSKSSWQITYCS